MDLTTLKDTPPWEWPEDAGDWLLTLLRDRQANATERLLAAELAGDYTVVDDHLAEALLVIVGDANEMDDIRGTAAISLGVALEHTDTMGFDDPDDVLISEAVFNRMQQSLHDLYLSPDVPADVRRKILEVSVRAPQAWHQEAIRTAYANNDDDWRLTAVFCMRFVPGFDDLILAALNSSHADIHYQAICAAGNWEVDAAWQHIAALITPDYDDKDLLLAAIEAVANIRPQEAPLLLEPFIDTEDEDIADAVYEGLSMAEGLIEYDDEDDEDDEDDDEFF